MPSTSFCPNCYEYVSPFNPDCRCGGWRRPPHQRVPRPGAARWTQALGGPVRGAAVVAGERVLFAWGSRAGGGLTALDRFSGAEVWTFVTPQAVETAPVVTGDRVVFATPGRFGTGGQIFCLNLADGKELWPAPLSAPGGLRTPLRLVENSLLYAADDQGHLLAWHLADGQPLAHFPLSGFPAGKTYLACFPNRLLALHENGTIHALHPFSGALLQSQPPPLPGKITCPPAQGASRLYFALETAGDSSLVAWDPLTQDLRPLAEGCKRIVAEPLLQGERLIWGDWNHQVGVVELVSGNCRRSAALEHSISATPAVGAGLLFCGANDGALHAFDAATLAEVWRFAVGVIPGGRATPVLCAPAFCEDTLYAGADDGHVYALPWHLGRYAWAAERAAAAGWWEEAAEFCALAAAGETSDLAAQRAFEEQAVKHWRRAGQPQRAAFYCAALLGGDEQRIAAQFQEAGILLREPQPALAAYLLRRSAEQYADCGERAAADECEKMAQKVAQGPYLTLYPATQHPKCQSSTPMHMLFELKNRGSLPASHLRLRLGGSFVPQVVVLEGSIAASGCYDVEVDALPNAPAGPGTLLLEVRYRDPAGYDWSRRSETALEITPAPPGITVEGDLGALIQQGGLGHITVRGDVGLLKVRAEEV